MIQTDAVLDKKEIQTAPQRLKIACLIVIYNPDAAVLDRCLKYLKFFPEIYVFDNSQTQAPLRFQNNNQVRYLHYGCNFGIAAALNALCDKAYQDGMEWALTMDQDSSFSEQNLESYLAAFEEIRTSMPAGVYAPCYTVRHKEALPSEKPVWIEKDAVMASGNILSLKSWKEIGGFSEELFMDTVDHDYCLRLKRQGGRVLQSTNRYLFHHAGSRIRVGREEKSRYRTEHPPERLYYIVRNNLRLWKEFECDFPHFIKERKSHFFRKRLVWILLYEKQKMKRVYYIMRGWKHFLTGRYGALDER